MILTTIYIVFALLIVFYFYLKKVYNYWGARGIPFDTPVFFFGNFYNAIIGKEHISKHISEIYNKFSDVHYVGIYIFMKPMLMVRNPDLLKRILVKDFDKFADRDFAANEKVDPLSFHTLFSAKSVTWRALRTKLSPVFTSRKIKMMLPLMQECGDNLSDYMKNNVGKSVQIRDVAKHYAVDVISTCAFGIDSYCLKNEGNSEIMQAATKLLDFNSVIRNISMYSFFFAPKLIDIFRLTFTDAKATNYLINVFKTTMKEREQSNIKRNDLIDLLHNLKTKEKISEHYKFDDLKMASQAVLFFAAGNDTTSAMIAFAFYELAINKMVQEKLRNELTKTFEKHSGLNLEAIQECKYLNMVVNESLRKYALVWFLNREALEDYVIEETGVQIDKGTSILVPVCGLHQDSAYFSEPEKFNPERFNEANKLNITPFTYLPFGEGPRNCIGQRFGLLAMKVALIYVIKDFALESDESTKIPIEFLSKSMFLQSADKIKLKVISL